MSAASSIIAVAGPAGGLPFGLRPLDALAVGAVFVLMLSVWVIAWLMWSGKKAARVEKIRRRVGADDDVLGARGVPEGGRVVQLFREGKAIKTVLPGQRSLAGSSSPIEALETKLHQAGMDVPVAAALAVVLGAPAAAFVLAFVIVGHPAAAALAAGTVLYGVWSVLKTKAEKRTAKFDAQFVEALGLCARSLRAGHTVTAALNLAAKECQDPVKSVFSDICQQQELGVTLEQSLLRAADDNPSQDLKLFAASVAIQIRAGGNLAETTNRLAAVMRDRLKMAKKVRVLIAESQMSKQVLLGLPVVMFVVLNVINPEYMKPMYNTENGQMMMMIAAGGMLIGAWAMNKLAVLKY